MASPALHVVTVIGLPLAGKSTFVRHVASSRHASAFTRRVGYRGFAARECGCFISLSAWGFDEDAMLIRTFAGAVWQDSAWTIAVAESDGLIVMMDPQSSRTAEHVAMLDQLARRLTVARFDGADLPVVATIGKPDLATATELEAARALLSPRGWQTVVHSGTDGAGVHAAVAILASKLIERRRSLPLVQDGPEALLQSSWDPFPPAR